ncbi:hypothetical protein [Halioxenophilus aromaticivorans]|uniref:Lipoprotein n=1 Tax=Halioxenophilus aromaticivorans TaxID=1306992 RepID=A0AAV3U941_9ALTE
MKYIIILVLISMLHGCATAPATVISYSPFFKVQIPHRDLNGAVFFQSDSISVRFSDGSVLSGLIIDEEIESLPPGFNLAEYPEFSLGLKSTDDLQEPYASLFSNSWEETKRMLENPAVTKSKNGNKLIYTACGSNSCVSFLVDQTMTEHIFMLSGSNFDQSKYLNLLSGI